MNIDDAINRLSSCHLITKEDEEVFKCAVECMKFTRDFVQLEASPERMKHALNLLNSLEYIFRNEKAKEHTKQVNRSLKEALFNKPCMSYSDHEWECCGISTAGTDFICKKCNARKTYPHEYNDQITVTLRN